MDKIMKNKKDLVTKQVQKNSFISYALPDQVWWCNIKHFWLIPKIISATLCEPIHDIIGYSTFACPSEFGMCGKEWKNNKKLNMSRTKTDTSFNVAHIRMSERVEYIHATQTVLSLLKIINFFRFCKFFILKRGFQFKQKN